jgi:hypothetical protein
MVLDYETQALPSPVPSVHNEILGEFRNQEPGDLPGALASALERSESARRANLASLNMIRGNSVQINLNLSESDCYRVSAKDMTTKIKPQQQALIGALFELDRMVRLCGRHLLL